MRTAINVIDHIYIGILPRSAHITINHLFSTFVTQHQRAHEQTFPYSQTTPHIMSIYWDRAKAEPELLIALNTLNPINNIKLYNLVSTAWIKVKLTLLQRARDVFQV